MASSSFLLESPASIFSSSSIKAPLYLPKPYPFIVSVKRRRPERKRNPVLTSAVGDVSVVGTPPPPPPPPQDAKSELISSLKLKLLGIVSGLNRGLAANQDDLGKADDAAKELETVAGPVDLLTDLDKLQGRWKLIYSSAFSSRTLGGSRPGLPTGRLLPVTLGQVFQRIDVISKDFDNIAEIELGAPWPLPPLEVTATLAHKFEIIGSSRIKITFEKTSVKTRGTFSQLPSLDVPRIPDALRPPSNPGSGDFDVTFIDADTRITRGDRGELRVFVIS
ncbi:hypothetical protein Golax_013028 [Gossypium laxum]|uniref:Plastid lipid-associated protein/fibrillin conserved domain-containing protein n=1 Tax=Gossypium laxum TaxID=34288 RepID=A0A7J8ZQY4_9ROSI|nr:hypothetical protein [Gossypium laxum]